MDQVNNLLIQLDQVVLIKQAKDKEVMHLITMTKTMKVVLVQEIINNQLNVNNQRKIQVMETMKLCLVRTKLKKEL